VILAANIPKSGWSQKGNKVERVERGPPRDMQMNDDYWYGLAWQSKGPQELFEVIASTGGKVLNK
jgi:hypothetical protein